MMESGRCHVGSTTDEGNTAPESNTPRQSDAPVASSPKESPLMPQPAGPSAVAGANHDERAPRRVIQKKILLPVTLAVLAGVLFVAAFALYPTSNDFSTPSYPTIYVNSAATINFIDYRVIPVRHSVSEIIISLFLGQGTTYVPANTAATVQLYLPSGIAFQSCPAHSCNYYQNGRRYNWNQSLYFKPTSTSEGLGRRGVAIAHYLVKARDFGYAVNATTAAAALPEVFNIGRGSPQLITEYDRVLSPSDYDWSAFPPAFANDGMIVWQEPIPSGGSPGRVSIGVNHAAQTKDSNNTFIAGALIGLAGGALLSAIQEAFRAKD